MIMHTKEQLAVLLRDAYEQGAIDSELCGPRWVQDKDYQRTRENAIQPILHRSSGGHDDHGREVKP